MAAYSRHTPYHSAPTTQWVYAVRGEWPKTSLNLFLWFFFGCSLQSVWNSTRQYAAKIANETDASHSHTGPILYCQLNWLLCHKCVCQSSASHVSFAGLSFIVAMTLLTHIWNSFRNKSKIIRTDKSAHGSWNFSEISLVNPQSRSGG